MQKKWALIFSICLASCGGEDPVSPGQTNIPSEKPAPDADSDKKGEESPPIFECQPVQANPGTTIGQRKYPLDGWNWQNKRELIPLPKYVSWSEPALVLAKDKLHLYLSTKLNKQFVLYHSVASLDNLQEWSSPEEVDGLAEARHPSVIFENGLFKMWFGGGVIGYAESYDGQNYTIINSNVLGPTGSDTFDSLVVSTPAVVHRDDEYQLWYTGFDGAGYAIGLATSDDGLSFSRVQDEPVVTKGTNFDFDNTTVAQPTVVATSDSYLMWYAGYDTSLTNPGPYRIGLATSVDGTSWQKNGVAVDLSEYGEDAYTTWEPAVVKLPSGKWFMVYTGMSDGDYKYRLMAVDSLSCGK